MFRLFRELCRLEKGLILAWNKFNLFSGNWRLRRVSLLGARRFYLQRGI